MDFAGCQVFVFLRGRGISYLKCLWNRVKNRTVQGEYRPKQRKNITEAEDFLDSADPDRGLGPDFFLSVTEFQIICDGDSRMVGRITDDRCAGDGYDLRLHAI